MVMAMAASQVVLYFDKQEDALLFTLAASSVMSTEGNPSRSQEALNKIAQEIRKASRITTEGVVESPQFTETQPALEGRCA
jgi:hypothetical protein